MAEERIRSLVTPPIHARGAYVTYAPFTLDLNVMYNCNALRSFDELVDRNIDVYAEYYEPKGLSETIYREDAAMGASIVVLESSEGEYVYVPNTYIESYPGMAGIRYDRKVIVFDLGPLPETMDVNYLINDLKDLVMKHVGIDEAKTDIKKATVPMASTVSHDEHVQLEATRRAAIQLYKPLAVQMAELTATNQALQEQVEQLTEVIAAYPDLQG